MNSYRELRVWQNAMDLVVDAYRVTASLPSTEQFGLMSQIRRAAVSIPSNIAEGHDREHINEYLHHLAMAQGSLAELETQIDISVRLNYVEMSAVTQLLDLSGQVGRQLHALRNALRGKRESGFISQSSRHPEDQSPDT